MTGVYLKAGGNGLTKREIAKFSLRDAERLDAYEQQLESVAALLRDVVLETPPNATGGRGCLPPCPSFSRPDRWAAGSRICLSWSSRRHLISSHARRVISSMAGSRVLLSRRCSALTALSVPMPRPTRPHGLCAAAPCFRRNQRQEGRLGTCHRRHGCDHRGHGARLPRRRCHHPTDAGVRRVLTDKTGAYGVETEAGERLHARVIASNLNPKLLFTEDAGGGCCPEWFLTRMEGWRCGSGVFRMNVALSELPDFTCLPGKAQAEHHASGIVIAPSLAYMEEAWFDARRKGWSERPIIEMLIPSTLDDSLAPPENTSQACSASMLRRNFPMAGAGTIIARPLPN